jgi:hypothetical protein
MQEDVALGAERDDFFRRVLVASTALAFGSMLGILGSVGKNAGGITFSFHWSSPVLFLVGCGLAVAFWRVVFRFDRGSDSQKVRRLKQIAAALLVVAFAAFFYPLRLVDPERRRDVLFGILLAFSVLGGFGFLIYHTIRFVEQSSREEEKRGPDGG